MGKGEGWLGIPGTDIDSLRVSLLLVVTHAKINFEICE